MQGMASKRPAQKRPVWQSPQYNNTIQFRLLYTAALGLTDTNTNRLASSFGWMSNIERVQR